MILSSNEMMKKRDINFAVDFYLMIKEKTPCKGVSGCSY